MTQLLDSEELAAMKLKRLLINSTFKKLANKEIFLLRIIELNKDLIAKIIAQKFNLCIKNCDFPSRLKHVNLEWSSQIQSDKTNFKALSKLSNSSKLYEKLIYDQHYQYF